MHATQETKLNSFKALATRFQDDAYTFAFYLLGEEECAVHATGTAFARISKQQEIRPAMFRAAVLRMVLESCHAMHIPVSGAFREKDLTAKLQRLGIMERSAVVLVDVLGCSYEEAGIIMSCSTRQVTSLLARGRRNLGRSALAI